MGFFGGTKKKWGEKTCGIPDSVKRFRNSLGATLFFRFLLPPFSVSLFLAGFLILLLRFFSTQSSGFYVSLLILCSFVVPGSIALVRTWRKLPSEEKLLIWLDSGSGEFNGLRTAALEVDPGVWSEKFRKLPVPMIQTGKNYAVFPVLAGFVFLVGAFFFPLEHRRNAVVRPLNITEEISELKQKIEVIEDEIQLPEKELAEVRNSLDELTETNNAERSGRTYELLEALARRVDSIGENSAVKTVQEFETMNMLSDALNSLSAQSLPEDAGAELADLMKRFALENPGLADLLKQLPESGLKLDPETMKKLAEAMKKSSAELRRKLEKLAKAKLMKSRCSKKGKCKNGKCANPGSCFAESEDLAEWLAENAPDATALTVALCQLPGKGGISKGRGDAELNFSGTTAEFEGQKKNVELEALPTLQQSSVLTHFSGAPQTDGGKKASVSGALDGGNVTLEQRSTVIYPEHRAVVERYFQKNVK